jgi:farnesyl-diphosphate farnesyltransferase
MQELVGVAHAHLRNALSYTLLIPGEEEGIRRFCLWAIGLAVLTLRRIERTPGFTAGSQVKVSRRAVALTRTLTSFAVRRDWLLRALFERAASGLPLATLSSARHPSRRYPDLPGATLEYDQAHAPAAAPRARRATEGRSTG